MDFVYFVTAKLRWFHLCGCSDSHVHLDSLLVGVVYQLDMLHFKLVNLRDCWIQLKLWERVWHPSQLDFQGFYVVAIHMGVSQRVNELTTLQATNLSQHASKQ